jgi:hypothetical protein
VKTGVGMWCGPGSLRSASLGQMIREGQRRWGRLSTLDQVMQIAENKFDNSSPATILFFFFKVLAYFSRFILELFCMLTCKTNSSIVIAQNLYLEVGL